MFHHLTRLELTLDFAARFGYYKWSWLTDLLPYFPKLQTLIIDEVFNA
jgi:hypothetical protein